MQSLINDQRNSGGWPWKIFIFMALVFGTTILVYLGLVLGYQPFLETGIASADSKIDNLVSEVSLSDQKDFLKFYSQIVNLRALLETHVNLDRFFNFLEKNTNKQVTYEILSLNTTKKEAVLEGVASNYERLGEQLEAIARASEVSEYILTQSQFIDGKINFRIFISLKPEVFKY